MPIPKNTAHGLLQRKHPKTGTKTPLPSTNQYTSYALSYKPPPTIQKDTAPQNHRNKREPPAQQKRQTRGSQTTTLQKWIKTKTPKTGAQPPYHKRKTKKRSTTPPTATTVPTRSIALPRSPPSNPPPFLAPPLASPVSLFPRTCF